MRKLVVPGIVVLLLVGVAITVGGKGKKSDGSTANAASPSAVASPQNALAVSVLADYDETAVKAYAEQGFPVLFFSSEDCATCKSAIGDIVANASSVPAGVKVFKVDYDSSSALRSRYGVLAAHTWVQVDRAGEKVRIWEGGGAKELSSKMMSGY